VWIHGTGRINTKALRIVFHSARLDQMASPALPTTSSFRVHKSFVVVDAAMFRSASEAAQVVPSTHLRFNETPSAFANFSPGLLQPWERISVSVSAL
jgi:hypothetical protein